MGACPEWYPLLRAARYLRVPPWELAGQPLVWQEWALVSEAAEREAEADLARRD
ncbi:MAG: hypothetical protein GX597_22360 [Anaerolineaceae bacterium]|nr:hypothetical protein [Anaerolineaceae bacterium]